MKAVTEISQFLSTKSPDYFSIRYFKISPLLPNPINPSQPFDELNLRFTVRDETDSETLPDFLETEKRLILFKIASRDRLQTVTSTPTLYPCADDNRASK